MRRIGLLAAVVAAVLTLSGGVVACSTHSHSVFTVFAADSLNSTFTKIGEQFKADNPGTDIEFQFAGSSELVTQLTQGASADVFATADTAKMDKAIKAGLVDGNPIDFASNTLVIVTTPGNPKGISSFADLNKPGLRVVVCQQQVPCGSAAQRIEDSSGVRLQPVSEEPKVSSVLDKVTTGQADAGLVYVTDAQNAGSKVTAVTFGEAADARNVYPIAVLKNAPQSALARKFVAMVTGDVGQKILAQSGFAKP